MEWLDEEAGFNTSTIAVEYDGGVVVGADSRTTTGSYVANRTTDKLGKVSEKIYCCRSGSAADTQIIAEYVRYYLDVHGVETGSAPMVRTAASLFRKLCYENKANLMAGFIVGGWDKVHGGQVFSIPLGGTMIKQPWTIGGSGSGYIYGWCDANYKDGMTKEEAVSFVRSALALAMSRDGSSGGVIRTMVINEQGTERAFVPGDALPRFFEGNPDPRTAQLLKTY